jgi:hypothetical protein
MCGLRVNCYKKLWETQSVYLATKRPPLWGWYKYFFAAVHRSRLADCVAKVESRRATNFSRKPETGALADPYDLNRITEVACEFNVRRRGPSHLYTKAAPVARRFFEPRCKKIFATISAQEGYVRLDGGQFGDKRLGLTI